MIDDARAFSMVVQHRYCIGTRLDPLLAFPSWADSPQIRAQRCTVVEATFALSQVLDAYTVRHHLAANLMLMFEGSETIFRAPQPSTPNPLVPPCQ